ncbi:MAG: hypothetical protein BGO14_08570 [Chlamydiales bacterium 38-26]|nr:glycosyltransferase family 61 protein [Chlamydiales bacterium]OJV11041.1 MAG: hypothetical protein BGO14_08570 [Chlamydiales bacterium 38-26]
MPEYIYKSPTSFKTLSLENLQEGLEGVYIRQLSSTQGYQIRKPLFLEDPDRAGFLKEVHFRRIYYANPFVLSLKNIQLIGVASYLTEKHEWFNDYHYVNEDQLNADLELLADFTNPYHNGWTQFHPTSRKEVFSKKDQDRSEVFLRGKTLVLCSQEPDVFGSWIFRILPKLNAAQRLELKYDQILIEPHERLIEYFELMGVDPRLIVKHNRYYSYKLEHAIIPSLQNSQLYLDDETQQFYSTLRQKFGGVRLEGNKLFVSRRKHASVNMNYRVLKNEEELEQALLKEGFISVYPEHLSVKDQIKFFSSASMIVGPSGSALFNCVYCQPNVPIIDIESQPFHLDNHAALFSSYGVNYGFLAGFPDPLDKRPVHRNWTVNIPALIACVRNIESSFNPLSV